MSALPPPVETRKQDQRVLKVLLYTIAAFSLVCCIGGAVLFGTMFYSATSHQADAKAYGDESVQALCSSWDLNEFERRFAPEVEQQNAAGSIGRTIKMLSSIGKLKTFKGEIRGIQARTMTGVGNFVEATYVADCSFENGPGTVTMKLIFRNRVWEVLDFRLNPK